MFRLPYRSQIQYPYLKGRDKVLLPSGYFMKYMFLSYFLFYQIASAEVWMSSLYPSNWEPGFKDRQGRFLHDFSYAGYRNGLVDIPNKILGRTYNVTVDFGADQSGRTDSTASFQSAINAAGNAGGGVVFIPAGHYRINGELTITRSGVVLKGAGPGLTKLRFSSSKTEVPHIGFNGSIIYGPDIPLAEDATNQSTTLKVANASVLKAGSDIVIGWTITDRFVAEHQMTGTWRRGLNEWTPFLRRKIVSINTKVSPHQITIDIPIRYDAKRRDGASLRLESGQIENVGIENLSISNVSSYKIAWLHDRIYAVSMNGVKNGWVRNITSFSPIEDKTQLFHLQSGGIIAQHSKNITITNCQMEGAQNRGPGGNGYLFAVRMSNEILVRDSKALRGRHNFIFTGSFGNSGNVFLRVESKDSKGFQSVMDPLGAQYFSEFHGQFAIGNLIDQSILHDGWLAYNRGMESSGAGHTSTQNVLWNITNGKILSFQYGMGYVIGTSNSEVATTATSLMSRYAENTSPQDFVEGIGNGSRLSPPSLYEHQLVKRILRNQSAPVKVGPTLNLDRNSLPDITPPHLKPAMPLRSRSL
jgi:hypothetical protein